MEKEYVKICPKCGSTDIDALFGIDMMTNLEHCRKCGNKGNFPEVAKDQVKRFKNIIETK